MKIRTSPTQEVALRLILSWTLPLVLFSGCATEPSASDFLDCDLQATALPTPAPGKDWPGSPLPECTEGANDNVFHALVLSGGGADGAFGAGYLAAIFKRSLTDTDAQWAPTPDAVAFIVPRPCLVTGISTGSILAPYAYLASSTTGDPAKKVAYIETLRTVYQYFDDKNLLSGSEARIVFRDSLHSADGIKAEISRRVTSDLIADIDAEYKQTNRTLLVGATDLYTGEFESIDLTSYVARSIAAKTDRSKIVQCFGEAIRASAAIPTDFPPVPIHDQGRNKLFVDGGVRHMVFANMALYQTLNTTKRPLTLYGVVNNTYVETNLLSDANGGSVASKKLSILDVAARSASLAANQLYQDSAWLTDAALRQSDGNPKSRWVDARQPNVSYPVCSPEPGTSFTPTYEQCLMDRGTLAANEPPPWRGLPPIINFLSTRLSVSADQLTIQSALKANDAGELGPGCCRVEVASPGFGLTLDISKVGAPGTCNSVAKSFGAGAKVTSYTPGKNC